MNNTKVNNISADMSFESIVTDYMMDNFWSRYNDVERVHDIQRQARGADIIISSKIVVDMKIKNSATISSDEPFPYPCIEMLQCNRAGDYQYGSFVEPKSMTTTYAYLTVHAKHNDKRKLKQSDIIKVNMMLFSKHELSAWIESYVPMKQLMLDSMHISKDNDRKDYYDKDGHKIFHLKYSFREGSIVLVIKRDKYLALPHTKQLNIYPNRIVKY